MGQGHSISLPCIPSTEEVSSGSNLNIEANSSDHAVNSPAAEAHMTRHFACGSSTPSSPSPVAPPVSLSPWKKLNGDPAADWVETLLGSMTTEAVEEGIEGDLDTQPWDTAGMEAAGVPNSAVAGVLELAMRLGARRGFSEPLLDPLTLLRFYNARDCNVDDALGMWRDSTSWREATGMGPRIMERFGHGAVYAISGGGRLHRSTTGRKNDAGAGKMMGSVEPWVWERSPVGSVEALADSVSFYGRLAQDHPADGAPVAVWRLGAVDWSGIAREGLQSEVRGF